MVFSNALDRVNALLAGQRCEPWPLDRLASLGHEAKQRWLALRQAGHDVEFAGDAVRLLDPEFSLAPDLEERIQRAFSWHNRRAVIRFLKWATCPKTEGAENPFEPLVEIIEHGGSLHVEHGMFLDIYDSDAKMCGIVLVR
jgi:hypothetical protein